MNVVDINQKDLDQLKPQQIQTIYDHVKMRDEYLEYAKNLQGSKVFTGFAGLDEKMNGIRPGEVVTILAPTNTGKSAMALNLLYNAAKQDEGLIFYFSTELSNNDIYERFVQLHFNLAVNEVENLYATNKDDSAIVKVIQAVTNIYCVIKKINPLEIPKFVQFVSEQSGRKARAIIVDHLQGLKLPKSINKAEALDETMQYLKEVALHSKLPVILTAHVSREQAKAKELSIYSGKGSGEIENSSQILFTLENLRELPEDCKPDLQINTIEDYKHGSIEILRFTAHKTKRGKYRETWLIMDNKNLKIEELNLTTF
jgi:replicative DNA helicase